MSFATPKLNSRFFLLTELFACHKRVCTVLKRQAFVLDSALFVHLLMYRHIFL